MWGAEQGDQVRLHGAIAAALNLYPRCTAFACILAPGFERLEGQARTTARVAINAHLLECTRRRVATGAPR